MSRTYRKNKGIGKESESRRKGNHIWRCISSIVKKITNRMERRIRKNNNQSLDC